MRESLFVELHHVEVGIAVGFRCGDDHLGAAAAKRLEARRDVGGKPQRRTGIEISNRVDMSAILFFQRPNQVLKHGPLR